MEHKIFPIGEHKVLDEDQGIVEHFVAITGNRDLGKDRIISGAFRKTILERGLKIRVLDQHRTDSIQAVIGKPISLQEVGRDQLPPHVIAEYPDATGGLKVTTQYLMDTPEGRGAFIRIKSGAVDEYSIGYDAIKGGVTYVKAKDGETERHLKEIKLYEYSPVMFGMNPATSTISAKEAPETDADEGEEQEPDSVPEVKAGRTISRATLERLKAARTVIDELCSMGEMRDAEDEEQPEEMKSAPGGVPQAADEQHDEQAGPVSPPTDAKRLLLEIEILESQLHTLEV